MRFYWEIKKKYRFLRRWINDHSSLIWWFHSFYALFFGIVFMWLGNKHIHYLQAALWYLAFIWISSLLMPKIQCYLLLSDIWRHRLQLFINYVHRNFYQQILFFLLPIYYKSASVWVVHGWFLSILAISALLSTLDLIYDHHISRKWSYMALFFSFNMFVSFYAMIPLMWKVSCIVALWLSGLLAVICFASFVYHGSGLPVSRQKRIILAAALLVIGLALFARRYIPAVPLQYNGGWCGMNFNYTNKVLVDSMVILPQSIQGRVYFFTRVDAPVGMVESLVHIWYLDGVLIYRSASVEIKGGRPGGFRFWSYKNLALTSCDQSLIIETITTSGQLVGRSRIH